MKTIRLTCLTQKYPRDHTSHIRTPYIRTTGPLSNATAEATIVIRSSSPIQIRSNSDVPRTLLRSTHTTGVTILIRGHRPQIISTIRRLNHPIVKIIIRGRRIVRILTRRAIRNSARLTSPIIDSSRNNGTLPKFNPDHSTQILSQPTTLGRFDPLA